MSIDKLQAIGEFVYILRDEAEKEKGGLLMPESSLKQPNTGKILSKGGSVLDENIIVGKTAVFNKQVGNVIEIFDTEITVLNGNQQLHGVI